MSIVPEPTKSDEQITDSDPTRLPGYAAGLVEGYAQAWGFKAAEGAPNEGIIAAAMLALAAFHPETPQQAADMLLFWRRRAELTDVDVAEICRRLFPKRLTPLPCPSWCTTEHERFRYDEVEDLADHEREVLVVRDDAGAVKLQVSVTVTDDLGEQSRGEAGIYIAADEALTPGRALQLVGAVSEGLRILAQDGAR